MKRTVLFFLFIFFVISGFSQENNDLSKVSPVKKGTIILKDGTTMGFSHLSVLNDSVVFEDSKSNVLRYQSGYIYRISKTRNNALLWALGCGAGAGLGAIIGTSSWDENESLKDKKSSFIVGSVIVGVLVGGIAGAFTKRNMILYKNPDVLSFKTGFNILEGNKPALMLTLKVNITK